MMLINYTFGQPRKTLIKLLRASLDNYKTHFSILENVHVTGQRPTPQSKQFDNYIVVTNLGFSNTNNSVSREYSFSLHLNTQSFEDMEDLTEAVEAVITTIRGNGIKWVEVESMIEDETYNNFERVLYLNALIGAENL